jgi:NADH:ubiquinone oxidoreductase subunit 5 (subunit L)/multisubunit Na+/H+ antiporter MnhA subunit
MANLPFLIAYEQYIKKEDVREHYKRQRKSMAFPLIVSQIIVAIMQLQIHPVLLELYAQSRVKPPELVLYSPYIAFVLAIFAMLVALYILLSKPDYKRVDAIASKYKAGEMIKASKITDNLYNWLIIAIMLVTLGFSAATLSLPMLQ